MTCATSLGGAACRTGLVVKVGRKVVARTSARGTTDDKGQLALKLRLTRAQAHSVFRALARGRTVKMVATTSASTPLTSAADRVVAKVRP